MTGLGFAQRQSGSVVKRRAFRGVARWRIPLPRALGRRSSTANPHLQTVLVHLSSHEAAGVLDRAVQEVRRCLQVAASADALSAHGSAGLMSHPMGGFSELDAGRSGSGYVAQKQPQLLKLQRNRIDTPQLRSPPWQHRPPSPGPHVPPLASKAATSRPSSPDRLEPLPSRTSSKSAALPFCIRMRTFRHIYAAHSRAANLRQWPRKL